MTILTSASSGPKEKSLLKITVYSSGHLRRYSSGLKTDLVSFPMAIAAGLSFYVDIVAPRERTHKQKDFLVLPGSAGASVNMSSSIWTAFPLLKQPHHSLQSNIQEWGPASLPHPAACPVVVQHVYIPLHSHPCYRCLLWFLFRSEFSKSATVLLFQLLPS